MAQAGAAKPVRILVVGAGAVGCFYAARLHNPPYTVVSLVARSNYDAISKRGSVHLKTRSFGEFDYAPASLFRRVEDAAAVPDKWDYVIIATKALPDISDDSALVQPVVAPQTALVLIQNGLGVEAPYRARFPHNVIISGVTVVSAEQTEPGVIVQNRWTRISLGPYTDGIGSKEGRETEGDARTTAFARLLGAGGIKDAEVHPERMLQMVRWHKIAINAAMNPSAVLSFGAGNATMAQDPDASAHLLACMQEVFRGAEAVLGEPLSSKLASAERILESTKRNTDGRPSMLLDWERGAPMELEVILGNPIRLARAKGVEMARLESMYALLKLAQRRRREQESRSRL
ncbi:2-dehydropantoate 2-reductase [Exidia glandulosa HHB12029]|uniref:2-dehydropantoate 2-reductase n=1 Tax=Exidia glandulosa HHB12029 TaxID=1314781 RepID=A0A165R2D7_EXIGL|nr:2-dehydropantoate 2-reductase [Exidia glandulosa HHB12029]